MLPVAAATPVGHVGTRRHPSLRCGVLDLDQLPPGVTTTDLGDLDPHPLAGQGTGHEQGPAVGGSTHTLAPAGDAVHRDRDEVALGGRRGRGARDGGHDRRLRGIGRSPDRRRGRRRGAPGRALQCAPMCAAPAPRPVSIVPSVLPADFSRLGEECVALEDAGVDRIQWDVMDGAFVPNLTFGPDVIASCRRHVSVPFEAQLMVADPDLLLSGYVDAGCDVVIAHVESTVHVHRTLTKVVELGAKAGVALNPQTPVSAIEHVLDLVDMVLVMTVNPGFGGQAYIPTMEPKVAEVKAMVDAAGLDVDIEVDGGVGPDTVAGAAAAGANLIVAGSALYRDPEGLSHAVADLRARAEAAQAAPSA